MKQRTHILWLVAICVAVAVSVAGYRLATYGRFDPSPWRDNTQIGSGVRLPMAERLVDQKTLVGRTRAEVIELLGEPEEPERATETQLMYRLAPIKGWPGLQAQWLVVGINEETGLVSQAFIVAE